jgi:alpha-L-fucosidase
MFDSSFTNYKITNTPYGGDIVKRLADACAARAMRLGLYYSPPDMHHPAYRDTSRPASTNWHGEPDRPQWPGYLRYMQRQLTELLTRYGPVALIWFDGPKDQETYDGGRFVNLVRTLQPAALVNDRIGVPGDYVTYEQVWPAAIPSKQVHFGADDQNADWNRTLRIPEPGDFRLWETCMTINKTWAFNRHDQDYRSSRFLIRALVEVASRGGNFLLNVGPRPDGTIQPEFQERLCAIGGWLSANGGSIYGTTYGPIQGIKAIRTTAKRETVFVHIFDWPAASLQIPDFKKKVVAAHLLATGRPLTYRQSDTGLQIDVPARAPDGIVSVVALRTP